jgi:hypothetical protein
MNAGYLIPKDWCVMASLTSVHLDPNNYENPFKFDPWRWEVTNLLELHLVWSFSCLCKDLKITVATIYTMFYACRKLKLWLVTTALPHLVVDIDYVLG